MTVSVSVCGLHVLPAFEPTHWQTGQYCERLSELDLTAALTRTRERVRKGYSLKGYSGGSFIAAAFHPGKADRCASVSQADMAVDPYSEESLYPSKSVYTVCGFYSDNFQTYCGLWSEHGPLMAYYEAFFHIQETENRRLLVANVHLGEVQRCGMGDNNEPPPFADPACATEEEMLCAMDALVGGG